MNTPGIDLTNGPRIEGTRITVFDIYYYLDRGRSAEEIEEILGLTAEQVQAGQRYIATHREEVDAVHHQIEERNARGNPPEIRAKLAASHSKLQAELERRRKATHQEATDARNNGRQ